MTKKSDKRKRNVRLRYQPSGATMMKNLNIRIEPELIELIREAAEVDRRPVSQWARLVLEHAAKEQLRRHADKSKAQ